MIVRGIEEHDLWVALEVANYAYRGNLRFGEGPEPLTMSHQDWRMRLGVEDLDGPGCRHWVPRTWWDSSWWDRKARHTYSACYHAHRDLLYAVFERAPHARVVTALAAYDGLRNFESDHRRVASGTWARSSSLFPSRIAAIAQSGSRESGRWCLRRI